MAPTAPQTNPATSEDKWIHFPPFFLFISFFVFTHGTTQRRLLILAIYAVSEYGE
jgi:hypothetical protein